MGAWGVGFFENDTACDWAYSLEESEGLTLIEKTIDAVFDDEEYIDADICDEALAAIDVLARLKGNIGQKDSYTEEVDKWVAKQKVTVPAELLEKAKKALTAIGGKDSELYELWEETEDFTAWQSELKKLEERLSS